MRLLAILFATTLSCATALPPDRAALHHHVMGLFNSTKLGDTVSPSEFTHSLSYLVQHMPKEDVLRVSPPYVLNNIVLALTSRHKHEWSRAVPFGLFLNDVLPYASLREHRDNWRLLFTDFMLPIVAESKSIKEAALRLNAKAWGIVSPPIIFSPGLPNMINHYSVFETMKYHNASCTGLSIFLVNAMRSVGIPARVAGAPHWHFDAKTCPDGDASDACGNHDWVEFWSEDDKKWHFIDQDAGLKGFDEGWFYPKFTDTLRPGNGNHSVYATSWASSEWLVTQPDVAKYYVSDGSLVADRFPMVWDWKHHDVGGWDVTAKYHGADGGLAVLE